VSSSDPIPPRPGLRERSKANRRRAILRAAMSLFAEQGYDETTIAEIADRAEVAPRTIAGYFAAKRDLATAFGDDIARSVVAAIVEHGDDGLFEAVGHWLADEAEHLDRELGELAAAMNERNPELASLSGEAGADTTRIVGEALAAYLDVAPDHSLVQIGLASIGATLSAQITTYFREGPSEALNVTTMTFLRGLAEALTAAAEVHRNA
jgi:AcrR family transcriptional regulator